MKPNGLDAVLAHYNDPVTIDDEWYVFVIDRNDVVVGHYDPSRRGQDVKGAMGTDINGYNFGPRDAGSHRGRTLGALRICQPSRANAGRRRRV